MSQLTVQSRSANISVSFSSLFFPFDVALFLEAVSRLEYGLTDVAQPLVTPGQRVRGDAVVARKGPFSIRLDMDRNTISVRGPDVNGILAEMEAIQSRLEQDLGFHGADLDPYYEFTASHVVRSKKRTLDSWYPHFESVPILEDISEVFGKQVLPFGLRLGFKDHDPTKTQWFDVNIRPAITPALDQYLLDTVIRNPDRDIVFSFARKLEDRLLAVLSKAEGG